MIHETLHHEILDFAGHFMAKKFNPRLRRAILDVVNNQLRAKDPPETAAALARLMNEGHSRQEAIELIGAVVIQQMFDVMKQNRPYDHARFVAALEALPRVPWERE